MSTPHPARMAVWTIATGGLLAGACTGAITGIDPADPTGGANGPGGDQEGPAASAGLPGRHLAASVGIRRLTAAEYDRTLLDVLEDPASKASELIADGRNPFDNDYTAQTVSSSYVEAAELLAREASTRLLANPARRDRIIGCRPASARDTACLESFVARIGRRFLRRPLTAEDTQLVMGLASRAEKEGDFYATVDAVLRTFLQHPEFLHRIEIGTAVQGAPGVFKLDDWELATRLAYFLWGSAPDEGLLDRVQSGALRGTGGVRAV